MPIGIETYGAYGPQAIKLITQIGKKIQEATSEKLSTFYLKQRISIKHFVRPRILVQTCNLQAEFVCLDWADKM